MYLSIMSFIIIANIPSNYDRIKREIIYFNIKISLSSKINVKYI